MLKRERYDLDQGLSHQLRRLHQLLNSPSWPTPHPANGCSFNKNTNAITYH